MTRQWPENMGREDDPRWTTEISPGISGVISISNWSVGRQSGCNHTLDQAEEIANYILDLVKIARDRETKRR